jgi:uncharacterized protein (TIGR03032 family)
MIDGRPAYVTALGQSDKRDGWRDGKALGGCLMAVSDGRIIKNDLCMPHSPRWHDGKLWVLESGTGRVLRVDPASGESESIGELAGFARGLAMIGPYAFIGLSKIREKSAMNGVPLARRRNQLKCGLAVIDLRTARVIATVDFQSAVEEVFDVQILPALRFPEMLGFHKDAVQNTFVIPPAELRQ